MFASVVDYVSVEKGWFSPYLFARWVIPFRDTFPLKFTTT